MKNYQGGTAVITGAASGFGLEASRIAAKRGMKVVMADVQQDALDLAAAEISAMGAQVLAYRLDISKSDEVEALAAATMARFGAPSFVFNNAGVGAGGLIWEHTLKDWEWVIGVNLMGVAHGVRVFTPLMLAAAKANPAYEGHIVNTASMAGLLNAPTWRWSPIKFTPRCCALTLCRRASRKAIATGPLICATKASSRHAVS
jgi:NAD(P)-dependent dehydrogenase (short-subunit alcohol dehydrogenase family)